jgi:hypothetical protein
MNQLNFPYTGKENQSMKRYISLVLVVLLLAISLSTVAQEEDAAQHTVTFDSYRFSFIEELGTNVNIMQIPGDPVESAGPGFSDAAKVQFNLYNAGQPNESLFDTGGVRFYRMDDLMQYGFLAAQVEKLQMLLEERPDLAQYESGINNPELGSLPYVPVLTHGAVLTARAHYVETEAVQGIAYIQVVSADLAPFTSRDFSHTFQGISSDGQYYVSTNFNLNTTLFPETLEGTDFNMAAFQAQWPEYLVESIATLNQAEAHDFTPSLDAIDAVVQSISFVE